MKDEAYVAPDRMERYTWHDGDLKFLTAEEFEEIKKAHNFKDFHKNKEVSERDRKNNFSILSQCKKICT